MRTFEQFRDIPNPIDVFEVLFRTALETLLPDLADTPWYVREREVVNLFVFRHLIPQFQSENLDISQIGIEVPVRKSPKTAKENLGKYADIVVWPHNKATRWRTCKPLVHIEWKNISCREKHPRALERQHEEDVCRLMDNQAFVGVSYAVLTEWRDKHVQLRCKRVLDGKEAEDFLSPTAGPLTRPPTGIESCPIVAANNNRVWCIRCIATCSENSITDLQGRYREIVLRRHACPHCVGGWPSPAS